MSAHTPGPWAVQDCQSELVVHHDKFDVAIVGIDPTYEYNSEQRANAKLIAAAPDLLRELLQVRDAIIGPSIDRTARDRLVTVGQRMEMSLDRINSALAKAGL